MLSYLKPDFYFQHYSEVTPQFLKNAGVKTILSDLDGTIALHDKDGDEAFAAWLRSLEEAHVALVIVSNNSAKRVDGFAKPHSLVSYAKCGKPGVGKIERELMQKGLNAETTLFLGDQIFTDVWCGKRLGVKTALVKPYGNEEPLTIKAKRFAEKALMKSWGMKG